MAEIGGAAGQTVVDRRQHRFEVTEQCQQEQVELAGRDFSGNVAVRDEDAFEDGVVAAGGAHAEGVPGLLDAVALGVAWHEGVDDGRVGRVAVVLGMQAEPGPDRPEAAEHLAAPEAVAAVHPLGPGGRQQAWQVIADFGMPGREDLAGHRLAQQPFE
jgi:hypothetical protein